MIKKGIIYGIPIALGYFPVAVTFGLMALARGMNETDVVLSSMLIFAGSAQFALATLIDSPLNATLIPIILNLRHLIYGCIVSRRIEVRKPFLTAFGLTDEVFALSFKGKDESFIWGLALIAYLSWVFGTVVGVLGGEVIVSNENVYRSLVFAFPALFFLLILSSRDWPSAFVGAFLALLFSFLGYPSMGILASGLLTPLIVRWLPWRSS